MGRQTYHPQLPRSHGSELACRARGGFKKQSGMNRGHRLLIRGILHPRASPQLSAGETEPQHEEQRVPGQALPGPRHTDLRDRSTRLLPNPPVRG